MARTNTLANFLTDVANAIRTKKGTQETISASAFDTEILNLPSGTYQTKNITISANGSQTITPDQGYDAIDEITITTQVPQKQLQTKSYNFTTNQTIELTPDTGYDGFDIVTLTINVPSSQINNQDKTITQNGQYTADTGYTGLGTVIVNVPSGSGDIKLFETERAMQADPNPEEGDLAVVYRSEVQDWDGESAVSSFYFPETVVFTTAISGESWIYGHSPEAMVDLSGEISSTNVHFSIWTENGSYSITYESSDGLTYTATTTWENPIVLSDEPVTLRMYDWSNNAGKFMQTGGKTFEGLYEYALNQPVDSFKLREQSSDNYDLVAQSNPGMDTFYSGETIFCGKNVGNKLREIIDLGIRGFLYLSQDLSVAYFVPTGYQNMYIYNNRWSPLVFNSSQTPTDVTYYSYDLTNMSRTEVIVSATNLGVVTYGKVLDLPANSYYLLGLVNSSDTYYYWNVSDNLYSQLYKVGSGTEIEYENKYIIASTQLTLSEANQLLPDKIGYGKNGIITGDSSVYDNLDYSLVSEQLGLTKYKTLSVSDSTLNSNKLYSLCGTNVETDASTYYRPIKYVLNPEYDFTEKMNTFVGDMAETKYLMKPEAFKCDNGYTCRLCIGVTNKKAYAVTHDDDNNIIYAELLFTTTQSNNSIYQHVVVDDYYYYFSAQYTTTNAIIKISRATGVISVNKFTVGVSQNTYLSQYSTFAELNNNLVYIDCNSSGRGNVLYITKNLEVIKNITYTYPDKYATEWSYPAVIIGNSIFWFIRCSKQRLFKFDGNSVTYSNEIGTGLGLTYMNHIFTDGTYIYGTWDDRY